MIWTAAFAAFAVGNLNVVSIVFGVLFIGLDFAIHLGMHFVDDVRLGESSSNALAGGCATSASAVFFSAAMTMLSFGSLAFAHHRGVASRGVLLVLVLGFTLAEYREAFAAHAAEFWLANGGDVQRALTLARFNWEVRRRAGDRALLARAEAAVRAARGSAG